MSSDSLTPATIRFAAMNFLAMREHSVLELQTKLRERFGSTELIDVVIHRLTEQSLQSDQRFTEAFVRMRQRQGKGPLLIGAELRERGIASELIKQHLHETDSNWVKLARAARVKRFGSGQLLEAKEKARQIRFLHSRGFAQQQIQEAFLSENAEFP